MGPTYNEGLSVAKAIAGTHATPAISIYNYNARAPPTLGYKSQLTIVPDKIRRVERPAVLQAMHFAINSLDDATVFTLPAFGGPKVRSIYAMSLAACCIVEDCLEDFAKVGLLCRLASGQSRGPLCCELSLEWKLLERVLGLATRCCSIGDYRFPLRGRKTRPPCVSAAIVPGSESSVPLEQRTAH